MDLKACRSFLAIIEAGSMNKAAAQLNMTQPTISRQIAKLEEDLGVSLFDRQAKSLHVTREGLLFARRAREMMELEQKTITELQSFDETLSGELTIGCGEYAATSTLVRVAAQFHDIHPGVSIRFITGDSSQIRELIEHGVVDVGLFMHPCCLDGLKSICWKQREVWGAVMPADHPLASRRVITAADLRKEDLILPYRPEIRSNVVKWLGMKEDDARRAGSSSLASTCALMVLNSIGIALTCIGVPAYRRPDLKTIPLEPAETSCLSLAWKERFPKPPLLEVFLDYVFSLSLTCSCTEETECAGCEDEADTPAKN